MAKTDSLLPQTIKKHEKQLLDDWLKLQTGRAFRGDRRDQAEFAAQAARFIAALPDAAAKGAPVDVAAPEWAEVREVLENVSTAGVRQGESSSQTATFVFSLKEPLFNLLRQEVGQDPQRFAEEVWAATVLLDKLGLYTVEIFQKGRESVIARQQEEMLELSTPVIRLWSGILALPLIGTLDSARTQVVMETLLQQIVASGAEIAIIDITGVPTVDTLVAQHLLKTVAAARLMGADCIISGIRPQIAQTIVHLGVQLDVISKATMADAFALALRRIGKTVADRAAPSPRRHRDDAAAE